MLILQVLPECHLCICTRPDCTEPVSLFIKLNYSRYTFIFSFCHQSFLNLIAIRIPDFLIASIRIFIPSKA